MSVGVVTVGSIWRHLCIMSHCPGCWPSWGLEYFFWIVWSMTTSRVLNLWTMDWGDNAKKRSPTIAWSWLCSIQKYKSATSKWTWKCGSQTFKRCERACCGGYVFINNTWQSTPLECVWNEILFGLCLVDVWLLNLSRQSFPGCFEPGGFLESPSVFTLYVYLPVFVFASLYLDLPLLAFEPGFPLPPSDPHSDWENCVNSQRAQLRSYLDFQASLWSRIRWIL